jgi:hypothetical protein
MEVVRVDAGHLGCNVRPNPHHTAAQLIGEFEGLQIQIAAGTAQQGVEKLHERRDHELVTPTVIEIDQFSALALELTGLGRQYLVDAIR